MINHVPALVLSTGASDLNRTTPAAAGTRDDIDCFRRFLAGDNEAFARLFDRYNHRLWVYCVKFVGDHDHAEDITQELWERVIRMRREPQEVRNPGGFFLRIARNLCLNSEKSRSRFSPLDEIPESAHPIGSEPTEMEEAIETALQRLSFEHREVLVLNAYCGYRFEEIADMLGKRPETIWMRASRARAQLRREVIEVIGLHHAAHGGTSRRPASESRDPGTPIRGEQAGSNDATPFEEQP